MTIQPGALEVRILNLLTDHRTNVSEEIKELAIEALGAVHELGLEEEIEAYLDRNPSVVPDEFMAFIRSFYPEYEVEE